MLRTTTNRKPFCSGKNSFLFQVSCFKYSSASLWVFQFQFPVLSLCCPHRNILQFPQVLLHLLLCIYEWFVFFLSFFLFMWPLFSFAHALTCYSKLFFHRVWVQIEWWEILLFSRAKRKPYGGLLSVETSLRNCWKISK